MLTWQNKFGSLYRHERLSHFKCGIKIWHLKAYRIYCFLQGGYL